MQPSSVIKKTSLLCVTLDKVLVACAIFVAGGAADRITGQVQLVKDTRTFLR